jgi:(heptosyl)LPS beta-1,4-glucosyltransferase
MKAGRKSGMSDLILRPVFLFLKMYILKRGFLDGKEGFLLAVFSANYVFTKYAKHWELNRKSKGADA